MTLGPGRREWFWYLRPGPGGMPLALRLSEGLGINALGRGFAAECDLALFELRELLVQCVQCGC
jgi:hypothetical protein